MRCQFCGTDNPEGRGACEKCNKPLPQVGEHAGSDHQSNRVTQRYESENFNPKKTLRESEISKDRLQKTVNENCPQCGYTLENGVCASCGYTVLKDSGVEPKSNPARKTVRPIRKEHEGSFSLTPISEENGLPEGEDMIYEGDEVVLNRLNTDPKNKTITSDEQAFLSKENGQWFIEDRSEYKTTFIQASRKMMIQDGDLILLGNQLYRFANQFK